MDILLEFLLFILFHDNINLIVKRIVLLVISVIYIFFIYLLTFFAFKLDTIWIKTLFIIIAAILLKDIIGIWKQVYQNKKNH